MNKKPFLAVLLAASLAGTSGIFIKYVDHIPPTSLSFLRTLLPTLLMGGWMFVQGIPFFRGNYPLMLVGSVLNAARLLLFFTAYIYTTIGNAVLISYTWPIFTTLFSVWFLKEQVSRRSLMLLSLSFLGIIIVYSAKPLSFESRDFIGMTAALGTAMTYSISLIIFKKESATYTRTEILFYQNLAGIFIFLPFFLLNPITSGRDISIVSAHAIFLGTFAFSFFFYGLKHLKASTASMLAYVEILSALLLSILWIGEESSWHMYLGGSLIIGSTMLLRK